MQPDYKNALDWLSAHTTNGGVLDLSDFPSFPAAMEDLFKQFRVEIPDDDDDEVFEQYDDQGVPTCLLVLNGPSPLGFFGEALKHIAKIIPPGAVIKTSDKGYEIWSRTNAT